MGQKSARVLTQTVGHALHEPRRRTEVEASILKMTKQEAILAAAAANLTHSDEYRKDERRRAFSVFLETKHHIKEQAALLP